ncbi:long-chain fatty acid--CoA ligase [Micrococcus flavus]|uniref:Long-chain acyl-CoA synthetase n=1 Tax=Micrococcus flavus TaxID=384602 RepID=A0A4Y8WZD3_9MICC|nr:long-chain fatty acid--CoA ligase [Micrococcus flavus]MBB4883864.1 long-chain acyl-CoA synthetase [Micrococcus flavus]TFI00114.1 long-chain fatty acid--CoA ligase [Micrococcus flavus]GGK52017.1 long-chain-fatty-acid--CoA ligase [Micrococcus flavus]
MTLTLPARLERTAAEHPDSPALVLGEEHLSYAELQDQVRLLAGLLRQEGIGPGDRVALMAPNVLAFPVVLFATLQVGAVVVPMNPLFKRREVEYYLEDSGASMLWAIPSPDAAEAAQAAGVPLRTLGEDGLAPHLAESPGPVTEAAPRDLEDDAVILYTSGTTGRPKGAQLTHRNIGTNADTTAETLILLQPGETVLGCLPLFHVFGLTCALMSCVTVGATLSLIPRFDPQQAVQTIEDQKVNLFVGVPTMYGAVLAAAKDRPEALASLRVAVSGGSSMPVELLRRFESAFGCEILEGYGLSETSPVACFNHPGEEHRPGSIGRAVRGCELQLVTPEGDVVAEGDEETLGEVWIRGENIMKGYWGRPEATAEAITEDGWFRSGDIGRRDSAGNYYIVDRTKDMILRGGLNVYPREIEEVLYEHPAVAEAAVVGVPHPELGQEIAAHVVLAPGAEATEEELIEHVKSQVAPYKYPRTVTVRDGLPKTATGKILKRELTTAE